jgi:predicted O-linked N-acetylglucosamine transferase (SPINDLY family)
LPLADLCLDTLPYNGGATSSDMLWAGVPLITVAGRTYAARMSGSLLHALGLPELITETPAQYERRALDLALDPPRLMELRARLAKRRVASPLFKTERFCRHLEMAYTMMVQRYRSGEPPADLRVAPLAHHPA